MSTYLSTPFQYKDTVPTINFELLNTVLATKQGRYNQAKQDIQPTLDAFGAIDVLREDQREYIASKLTDVTNQVNSFGNRDLSESFVTDTITNNIKTVAQDPYILSAIENAKKLRTYQTDIAKYKEKNSDKFSDINYEFSLAQAGVPEYMSGEADSIGTLSYTPYTDYNKKVNDFIIDLEGKKKDQTIQIPDGRGGMIEQTISGLSPSQLRTVAESMLDVNDKKQIEIDGWYHSGGYKDPAVLETVQGFVDFQIRGYDDTILDLNKKLKDGGLSSKDRISFQSQIDNSVNNKKNLQKNLDYLKSNPRAAATYLEQEKVYSNITNRFSGLYTENQKVVKDEVYWANKNYELDQNKHLLNVAEFQYKQAQDALKNQESLTGGSSLITLTEGLDTEELDVQTVEQEIDSTIGGISAQLDTELNQYKASIADLASKGNLDAKELLQIYDNKLKNRKPGQTESDIFRATVLETDSTNDNLSIIGNKNYKATIRALTDDLDLYTTGRVNAEKGAKTSHIDATINNAETFKAYYDNPQTKMLWQGRAVPVKDVLIAQGLMDKRGNKVGDLKTNNDVLRSLEQSYYADAFISRKNKGGYLRKLANSFGENPSDVAPDRNNANVILDINGIDINSKTGQFLQRARQQGIYDTFGFYDQSLSSDDNTVSKFLKDDYKNNPNYKNSLQAYRNKLPNSQTVGVPATEKALYNNVLALATAVNPSFKPVAQKTINIKEDGDYVYLYQTDTAKKDGEQINLPQQARVLKTDFQRNLPQLSSRLNFNAKSAVYTQEKLAGKPLISQSVKYIPDSANVNFEWASEVLLRDQPQFIGYLTNTDSKQTLRSQNSTLIQQFPEASSLISNAIDNSSDYSIQIELSKGFSTPKLYLKMVDKNSKQEIHALKIENFSDADNFKPILDNAPQVYYSLLVNDILKKQLAAKGMGSDFDAYNKLKQSLSN